MEISEGIDGSTVVDNDALFTTSALEGFLRIPLGPFPCSSD